jgi:hypothetical protein
LNKPKFNGLSKIILCNCKLTVLPDKFMMYFSANEVEHKYMIDDSFFEAVSFSFLFFPRWTKKRVSFVTGHIYFCRYSRDDSAKTIQICKMFCRPSVTFFQNEIFRHLPMAKRILPLLFNRLIVANRLTFNISI